MKKLEVGFRRGHLVIEKIFDEEIMFQGPYGPYIGEYGEEMVTLRCDCGEAITEPSSVFRHNKKTLTCGMLCRFYVGESEKLSNPPPKKSGGSGLDLETLRKVGRPLKFVERGVAITVSFPGELEKELRMLCGGNFSSYVVEMIRAGMKCITDGHELKLEKGKK